MKYVIFYMYHKAYESELKIQNLLSKNSGTFQIP